MSGELQRLKQDGEALARAYRAAGGDIPGHERAHLGCLFCDSSDAFSLYEHEGVARFKCHSCSRSGTIVELVMRAENLEAREAVKSALKRYGVGVSVKRGKPRKPGRRFDDYLQAEAWLKRVIARDGGRLTASWTYEARSRQGEWIPDVKVLRFDFEKDGKRTKQMRPVHRVGTGWRIGLGPWGKKRLCPLYNLHAIEQALEAHGEGGGADENK